MADSPAWRLPDEVRAQLRQREWDNRAHRRARMLSKRSYPITLPLHPPTGPQILADITGFRRYQQAWHQPENAPYVEWEERNLRRLGQQQVPSRLRLNSLHDLAEFLGPDVLDEMQQLHVRVTRLVELDEGLFDPSVNALPLLERLSDLDMEQMVSLLPQLRRGLGEGGYLRNVPVTGVGTKFLESHFNLVEQLMDGWLQGEVNAAGGLLDWLGCRPKPSGWLLVRPLSSNTQRALLGHEALRMDANNLYQNALPGERLLVVENWAAIYTIPAIDDGVAVLGTGLNLRWLAAPWLKDKRVAYWGDIDSHGMKLVADARQHCEHIESLMMDVETYHSHLRFSHREPSICSVDQTLLTDHERELYELLLNNREQSRLEQEYITADWVRSAIDRWLE